MIYQKRLIAYAYSFISYLFRILNTDEIKSIKGIYLFGSVAEGRARPESDIDIFIDSEKEFKVNVERFYNTREFKLFKEIGIENPINLIVGRLEDWNLKLTIEKNSIVMYGKKISTKEEAYIFWWETPKENVNFHRRMFGYYGKNKRYKGLIEKIGGMRIGKNAILIKNANKVIEVMKEFNVKFKMKRVFL